MDEFSSCTFEASEAWRELLHIFPLRERWIDGDSYRLYYWTHKLYRSGISTPFRDRMAIAWNGGHLPPDINFEDLAFKSSFDNLIIKDIGLTTHDINAGFRLVHNYVNSDVLLDDHMENRLKHSARKNLRQAQDIHLLKFEINPEGVFENFYQLHLETRHRLGVLPYPKFFFKSLFKICNKKTVLFACNSPVGILGYLVCYLHGEEMISGHMMYDFKFRYKRITDFLYINAFTWGRENGFKNYRFGSDNCSQVSLIESKQKLGAITRPQFDFHMNPQGLDEYDDKKIIRSIFRNVPRSIFRHSGVLTNLYFN